MISQRFLKQPGHGVGLGAEGPSEPFGGPARGGVAADPTPPARLEPLQVELVRPLLLHEADELGLRAHPAATDAAAVRNVTLVAHDKRSLTPVRFPLRPFPARLRGALRARR